MQGETVPYIICVEKDAEGQLAANQKGLAERARHPEEVNAAPDLLAIDAEYYLTQQVTSQSATCLCCLLQQSNPAAAVLAQCYICWFHEITGKPQLGSILQREKCYKCG